MADLDSQEIQAIIGRVRDRLGGVQGAVEPEKVDRRRVPVDLGEGVFTAVEAAAESAWQAFQAYSEMGLEGRRVIIDAIRQAMLDDAAELAQMAHVETGLGRTEDKTEKNRLVAAKTPGPEDLEPAVVTGDQGMTVTEYAPFGVVAAITPTTNPTATIINNTIAIVSAGNALVFNAHPNAKGVSAENVRRINRVVVAAGGPENLVATVDEPTIASAQQLMRHPRVRLLMVTGGPGVVEEALKTDKRAITAGPGNPPVVVDETADIGLASTEIIRGASFDNNMVCTDEKEVFVVASRADELLRAMAGNGAVVLKEYQLRQLERVIFERLGEAGKPGRINRKWIGQNAGKILAEIGVAVEDDLRLVVAEVTPDHSLVWTEQMMPVMPVVRVKDADEGIDLAVRAEHGLRHTASIFSSDVDRITRMARAMNVSIFVANSANVAGLGGGGEDFSSFSIATPTGEGLTRPRTFSRIRRLAVVGSLRIV
ncbi:MAG: aldehyde dehydrogenase family protein [Thermoanaerobaculia bacterium]